MKRLTSFALLLGLGIVMAACATSLSDSNGVTYHNEFQEYIADNRDNRGRRN